MPERFAYKPLDVEILGVGRCPDVGILDIRSGGIRSCMRSEHVRGGKGWVSIVGESPQELVHPQLVERVLCVRVLLSEAAVLADYVLGLLCS